MELELGESESESEVTGLSESEFTCHCCYQVLMDPPHSPVDTASADTVWPAGGPPLGPGSAPTAQCRAVWVGFPKVNILLR